jgi:NADH-quinone oxidoreductase subunit L
MFLGCGVAAFSASIFHLMTHAFFKALLFLAAGSVLHALSEEHDMRKMGGLYRHMRVTAITFWVAALAISALPPLSGFFSKDEILWRAFSSSSLGPVFWAVGVFTGGMTSFYVARVGIKTFHGTPRWSPQGAHPHESPPNMTLPLAALAILSAIGGFVGIPQVLGGGDRFGRFLEPVFAGPLLPQAHHAAALEGGLMATAVGISLLGILAAVYLYAWRPELPAFLKQRLRGAYTLVLNKYYVDEGYRGAFVRPAERLAVFAAQNMDVDVVDGAVNGIAKLVNYAGLGLRRWQTGLVRNYALTILLAIILLLLYTVTR